MADLAIKAGMPTNADLAKPRRQKKVFKPPSDADLCKTKVGAPCTWVNVPSIFGARARSKLKA
jgi:hypothetical protein